MGRAFLTLLIALSALGSTSPAPAEVRIEGRVLGPDGAPVAGVEVKLIAQTGAWEFNALLARGRHYPQPVDRARTQPDGSYELRAPEPGMWHLLVAARNHRPMEFNFWPLLDDRRVPDLELAAETRLQVRVTDPSGRPVEGAYVRASSPPDDGRRGPAREFWRPAYRQAITDADGRARIGRGADEAIDVYAYAAPHFAVEQAGVRGARVDLRLTPAHSRELRVETPRGDAIAGALVRIGERRWPVGRTDDDGRVTVHLTDESEPEVNVLTEDGRRLSSRLMRDDWPADGPLALTLEPLRLYSGRLVADENRAPLGGGFVWISRRAAGFVRTDATGGYEIAAEADRRLWIWGAAPDHLPGGASIDAGAERGPTIPLRPALRVGGVVVDERDQPVEGALVAVLLDLEAGGRSRGSWMSGGWLTPGRSDSRGQFSVGRLDPDAAYQIRASKPGFAPAEVALSKPRTDARGGLRLVLEAGRAIVGLVVDTTGAPVAGARVKLGESLGGSDIRSYFMRQTLGEDDSPEAFSEPDGRFRVPDLPVGRFDLTATAPGHAPAELATVEITATTPEVDVGEVVLPPGYDIEGRVTDADGAALEGVQIFATPVVENVRFLRARVDQSEEPVATTDVNGLFTVSDRREGEKIDLAARMAGYAEGSVSAVSVPTHSTLSIVLERASRIRGEVVDVDGRPVEGARISVMVTTVTAMTTSSRPSSQATTDAGGRFLVENVSPGDLELRIYADGYVQGRLRSLRVEPGRDLEGVRAVLERGARVSGRITGPDGQAIADAMVMAMETQGGFGRSFHSGAASDGEGRYRLDGLPPGQRTIGVRHEDYQDQSRSIEVEAGDNNADFVLERGLTLSGQVTDTAGQPVAGAKLRVMPRSFGFGGPPETVSDSTGRFELGGLTPGSYDLHANKEGFATRVLESLEVGAAGLAGVDVRLETGAAIVGRLLGLDPADYASVEVFASKPPRSFSAGRVNRDGTYHIGELGPGDYSVQATSGTRGLTAEGTATIDAGVPETVLDLEFEAGLTLTGVVLRSAEPVAGAALQISGLDVSSSSSGTSDNEGRFAIRGLEPGRYRLLIHNSRSGLSHEEEIELRVDRDVTVRLAVAQVSGVVRDGSDSAPIAGVTLQLESLEPIESPLSYGRVATTMTDSDGYYRFAEASAGSYRLLAQKEGYAPGETSLTVIEGEDVDGVDLALTESDGIRVYVTMPDGQPADGFLATVHDPAGHRVSNGSYGVESDGGTTISIGPGTWTLAVTAIGVAVTEVSITVPSDPITVPLQPEARLQVRVPELEDEATLGSLTVLDASGRVYRGMQWLNSRTVFPIAQGRATVPGLSAGSWTVQATAPDGRSWQAQVQLATGDNPELVLR